MYTFILLYIIHNSDKTGTMGYAKAGEATQYGVPTKVFIFTITPVLVNICA